MTFANYSDLTGRVVGRWSGGGGGGSQPVKVVRKSLAWDTPGLAVSPHQSFPIIGIDQPNGLITIDGDESAIFTPGFQFVVTGSTGNDFGYTVASVAVVAGDTVIDVGVVLNDPTVDGDVETRDYEATGIVVYTPEAGETLLLDQSFMSIPTPFDGNNTNIALSYSDLASGFGNHLIAGLQDPAAGDNHSTIPILSINGSEGLFGQNGVWVFPDATPLRAIIDDTTGDDPGMSDGAGEIVLVVLAA